MDRRTYYEAYDDRYQAVHARGLQWFSDHATPILAEVMGQYAITPRMALLELGCGEGRDAIPLLDAGYSLLATDISPAAIRYCRSKCPDRAEHFQVLDCIRDTLDRKFDFIYAVAVVHMFVTDKDRDAFYRFLRHHLTDTGIALICAMGDGLLEHRSDIRTAFQLQERACGEETLLVAGTSCRTVSTATFAKELARNGLAIADSGQTAIPNEFPAMMYAVVRKA